jgi:hypothetical protein
LFFNTANLKQDETFNETKLDDLVGCDFAQRSKRLVLADSSVPASSGDTNSVRNKPSTVNESQATELVRVNKAPKYKRTYKKCVVPTRSGRCNPRSHEWWKPTSDLSRDVR